MNPRRRRTATPYLVSALLVTAISCDDAVAPLPSAAVYVRFPAESVFVGETNLITAVATGPDSSAVEWPRFAWTSSDTTVAVVDSTGTVRGLDVGTSVISAEFDDRKATVTVRVVLRDYGGGVSFSAMAVGENFACALSTLGAAFCSPLSIAEQAPQFSIKPGAESVSLVSLFAAPSHQCGLTSESVMFCWGANSTGEFLNGNRTAMSTATATAPAQSGGPLRFASITVASDKLSTPTTRFTCGIELASHTVLCAGSNSSSQLGHAAVATDTTVTAVGSGFRASRVSASTQRACAIDEVGGLWCWGNGSATPKAVSPGVVFADVYTSDWSICARMSDGQLMCAPAIGSAALANLTLAPAGGSLRFKSVVSGAAAFEVSRNVWSAAPYTCGLSMTNELYCWGDFPPVAISSRLGDRKLTPFRLARGVQFESIGADRHHLCGVTTTKRLVCM